jgi:hypothetical protein
MLCGMALAECLLDRMLRAVTENDHRTCDEAARTVKKDVERESASTHRNSRVTERARRT